MTLSVIIVNWNVRNLLRECLKSMHNEMLMRPDEMEVLVVDNHSSDGSMEMVLQEFPEVRVIANQENRGFGRANNQAYAECNGRFVLLLNPDTFILNHAIDLMAAKMENRPEVAVLGCRLVNGNGSFQRYTGGHAPNLRNLVSHFLMLHKFVPARYLPRPFYLESDPRSDIEVDWVSGACMMLRREAVGDCVFDERFFLYGEDLELCVRLRRRGWRILYSPEMQVVHYSGKSIQSQPPEMEATKLKAMREVFAISTGRSSLLAYDIIVTVGFALRTVFNGAVALIRPGRGFNARFSSARRLLAEALRALLKERR